jgi:protein gp37
VPALLGTAAAVRFVSAEPLLGPVSLRSEWTSCDHEASSGVAGTDLWECDHCGARHREVEDPAGDSHVTDVSSGTRRDYRVRTEPVSNGRLLDWVIVGGESGKGARPLAEEWARSLVQQCQGAGLPVFVKQMGREWAREHGAAGDTKGGNPGFWPTDLRVREFPAVAQ